jgi:hypothetical protein
MSTPNILTGSFVLGLCYSVYIFPHYLKDIKRTYKSEFCVELSDLIIPPICTPMFFYGIHQIFFSKSV